MWDSLEGVLPGNNIIFSFNSKIQQQHVVGRGKSEFFTPVISHHIHDASVLVLAFQI